jgi:hypothetical protein
MAKIVNDQQTGELPAEPPQRATIWSDEQQAAAFDDFQCTVSHQWVMGKRPLPIAGALKAGGRSPLLTQSSEELCKVVTLHKPIVFRVIEWRAVRTGVKPKIPLPLDLSPEAELLDASVTQALPQPTGATGLPLVFAITGTMTYVLRRLSGWLPAGRNPAVNLDASLFEFVDADFDPDLCLS